MHNALKKKRVVILIVDDDGNDQFLVQMAFKENGIHDPILAVSDGKEAVDYLEGQNKYADREAYPFPTFLLVDLKMPRMNGFELLKFIREHPQFGVIPTIVFTSSADDNDVMNAYLLGANSYQVKAHLMDELIRQMKLIYDYWTQCEVPLKDKYGNLLPTQGEGKLSEKVKVGT